MSLSERSENDMNRSIQHDAFITNLKVITRYLKAQGRSAEWEPLLEQDRKEIGDLACYIHCELGIQNR